MINQLENLKSQVIAFNSQFHFKENNNLGLSHARLLQVLGNRYKIMNNLRQAARVLARRNTVTGENARFFASDSSDILVANGVPPVSKGRKVTIYSPSKTPMQSGTAQTLAGKHYKPKYITSGSFTSAHCSLSQHFPWIVQAVPRHGELVWRLKTNGSTL